MPQDRVFGSYNYYDNVRGETDRQHREIIGFEKTFLDGNGSIGMRLPFFQSKFDEGGSASDIDDLSIILKYAFWRNLDTGSMLSAGMVITAPTGPNPGLVKLNGEEVHATLLQPFLGYYWSWGDLYVHGFTSVLVPSDDDDVTILFNSVAIGYWLYRGNGILSAVIPTFEAHVNTPLTNRSPSENCPRFRDSVDLTGGTHFVFGERTSLGVAVGTPVTGPRLFDVEAIVTLNWRF